MAKKFMMNGKTYNSMMDMARELGVNRIYPRNFEKYGITEVSDATSEPTAEAKTSQDVASNKFTMKTNAAGETTFYDPTTRRELVGRNGENFHKRAYVTTIEQGSRVTKYLVSYGGVVAMICSDKTGESEPNARVFGTYSSETFAHIREFLQQNGLTAYSCAQVRSDYMI